jgi:two-component system phosphate regulon sensor histidine kinase PhoR
MDDTPGLDAAAARRDLGVLIELLAVGVVRLDDARRIELANTAAHTFLDRAPGTLVGMTAIAAFLDARLEAVLDETDRTGSASDEVHLTGTPFTLVARARRASGGGTWVVLEDVSELRRLQQIRAEFIDNLSHELRTPLTTVSLLAETLRRDADAAGDAIPARMRDRIGKIEVETGHLVQMVDELLDLSRIESGGRLVPVDDVDMGRVAIDATERLGLFAERQGVHLVVEVAGDVPSIRGDAERLGQVFVNLLHNAVKFSPDGGVVTVSVRRDGDRVLSSVADRGPGIPKAAQERIFERFYKVDRARVRGAAGGTGLGLAIARHIIEQHGGTIWVRSVVGRGSTFAFALPVATPVT